MTEWFQEVSAPELTLKVMALRLVIAAITGLVVAVVYYGSQRRTAAEVVPYAITMVMLTILVAMTTLVIGSNVARAFSLVGALSIVRFRTSLGDTRDTAFVICAVVVGMAIGTGNLVLCGLGLSVVTVMALLLHGVERTISRHKEAPLATEARLELRVESEQNPELLLAEPFRQFVATSRLTTLNSVQKGSALELRYRIRLLNPDSKWMLVKALTQLPGVLKVDLKDS